MKRALQLHRRVINALHRIASLALQEQPLPTVLHAVVQEVSVATGFPIVAIELYDAAQQLMEFAAAIGMSIPVEEASLRVPVTRTLSGLVAQRGQAVVETHAQERPEYADPALRQLGVQTFVCLPLIVSDQVIGTLALAHPHTIPLDADLVPLAQSLTSVIATLITRRWAEERSVAAEGQLRAILDKLAAGVVQLDAAGRFRFANQRGAAMFGLTPADLVGKSLFDLFPPAVAQHYLERNRRFIATHAFEEHEETFDLPVGRRTFFIADQVLTDVYGAGRTLLTSAIDITARTETEVALQESQQNLAALIENTDGSIWSVGRDYRLIVGNHRFHHAISAVLGRPLSAGECVLQPEFPQAAIDEWRACYDRAMREGPFSVELSRRFTAEPRMVEYRFSPITTATGQVVGVSVFGQDITDRKANEAALRRSERTFRALYENMQDAFVVVDMPGSILQYNRSFEELLGYSAGELAQLTYHDITPERWHAMEARIIQEEVLTRGYSSLYEKEYRRKDGSIVPIELRAVLLRDEQGQPAGLWGIIRDITERRRAEEQLRALNQTLEERVAQRTAEVQDLYDHAPIGYHSLNAEGAFVRINQTQLDWLGYTREELVGRPFTDLITPASQATFQANFPAFMQRGWVQDLEFTLVRKDGSSFPVLLSATAVYDAMGAFVMSRSTVTDITALKQAEEARRTSAAKLQAAMESMTDAVFISDLEGRFVDFNTAFVTFHKFRTRAECATTLAEYPTFLDVFLPDGRLAPLDQWAVSRALRGECVTNAEYHLRRKDTGETWVGSYNFAPIRAGDGTIIGSVVVGRDITERKQIEAALRESETRYRTLLEQMSQGVLVYQDEQVVFANAAAAQIIGYRVEDLQHATLADLAGLLHADDLPRVMIPPEERPAIGSVTAEPFRFTRITDGALRWVFATSTRTTDRGRPAVLAVFTDVTALKETEERLRLSEARLQLLLAKTPAVIFSSLAEPDYRSTFISESVRQVLGYAPAQFMASPGFWANRIHPEDKTQVFSDAPQLLAQGWRQYEYRCRHADGSYRWVESGVSLLPAVAGHPAEVVGYMIDITTRKEAEELLRQANLDLARAARLKDEFLATMSHELRTPLNAILGFSESLQAAIYEPLTARQQAAVHHIETSGRHLLTLINDILDLSKVEAGQLTLVREWFELAEVCQASLLFVKELAHKKALQLSFELSDPQAMMEGDSRRLKQMLVNLLSNAVKFTPDGGQVSLEVTIAADAGEVRFAVQDTGIGIAPEEQGRLFEPFVQLDSSLSRQHPGTGLGLALVRRLAELHGGRVTLESAVGAGSCFTLILPQQPPTSTPGPLPSAAPTEPGADAPQPVLDAGPFQEPGLACAHILLAEDNESSIQLTRDYLQARGFAVRVARTGREALAAAVAQPPDLLLLDIQLPELDGLELMRRLRAMPTFATTPILALTALAMLGDRERCLEAGASAYLTKPVRFQELLETIRRLLQG